MIITYIIFNFGQVSENDLILKRNVPKAKQYSNSRKRKESSEMKMKNTDQTVHTTNQIKTEDRSNKSVRSDLIDRQNI